MSSYLGENPIKGQDKVVTPRAQQPWLLLAYADELIAGGLPHVLDLATYTNIDQLVPGTPLETAGSTGIWLLRLPYWARIARVRVLSQDASGESSDNDTATIELATYPLLNSGNKALRSMLCRAVLTFGATALSSQTVEPFTNSDLSATRDLREPDTAVFSKRYSGPIEWNGFSGDDGTGEIICPLDYAEYLAFTFVARSNTHPDNLVVGCQLEF